MKHEELRTKKKKKLPGLVPGNVYNLHKTLYYLYNHNKLLYNIFTVHPVKPNITISYEKHETYKQTDEKGS